MYFYIQSLTDHSHRHLDASQLPSVSLFTCEALLADSLSYFAFASSFFFLSPLRPPFCRLLYSRVENACICISVRVTLKENYAYARRRLGERRWLVRIRALTSNISTSFNNGFLKKKKGKRFNGFSCRPSSDTSDGTAPLKTTEQTPFSDKGNAIFAIQCLLAHELVHFLQEVR